jgi:hypothetical protein
MVYAERQSPCMNLKWFMSVDIIFLKTSSLKYKNRKYLDGIQIFFEAINPRPRVRNSINIINNLSLVVRLQCSDFQCSDFHSAL